MNETLVSKYYRSDMLPHIWCPGCGNGILTRDIVMAIDQAVVNKDKVCVVSGIGCSSRAAGYLDFNTIHTTHGRAIAVATGIKIAKPELTVIVITGDGDALAIGGNHFIHGARRNVDLTVVIFNNGIYGMTGGQYSPTTPFGAFGTTAPYGSFDTTFDAAKLAIAAGASYVARGSAYHTQITTRAIRDGIRHKGFAVIDCLCDCPTYFGRKNKRGDSVNMMTHLKNVGVDVDAAKTMTQEELQGKIILGTLHTDTRKDFSTLEANVINKAREGSRK